MKLLWKLVEKEPRNKWKIGWFLNFISIHNWKDQKESKKTDKLSRILCHVEALILVSHGILQKKRIKQKEALAVYLLKHLTLLSLRFCESYQYYYKHKRMNRQGNNSECNSMEIVLYELIMEESQMLKDSSATLPNAGQFTGECDELFQQKYPRRQNKNSMRVGGRKKEQSIIPIVIRNLILRSLVRRRM